MNARGGAPDPGVMRTAVRDYVAVAHSTYIDHVRHLPPAVRAALPLLAAPRVTVAAAAARRLHLVATTDPLDSADGSAAASDSYGDRHWTVRFYDPSVLPALGLLPDDSPAVVRQVLGISNTLYHLTVELGGGLDAHHAHYSGVALANLHASRHRDLDRLRAALPTRVSTVDELEVCVRTGLDRAAALLAADLTHGRVSAAPGTSAAACLDAVLHETVQG